MKTQHFGCWTNGANAAVARLVARIIGRINKASLCTDAQIAAVMRKGLTSIGEGACDTVGKEAVLVDSLLVRAFEAAQNDGFTGTDESSLVERLDQVEVSVVQGSDRNIKITKPSDMALARLFLEEETAPREL